MNLNSLLQSDQTTAISKLLISLSFIFYLFLPGVFAEELKLNKMPGWQQDNLSNAWSSWQQSCIAFEKRNLQNWNNLCIKSSTVDPENTRAVRMFFEENFKFTPISNTDGSAVGTITGYYEPVLAGSLSANADYRYPIYSKPDSASVQTLSRKEIAENPQALEPHVIAWTDNPYDLFFLHIQGSGLIRFDDGSQKSLAYAGNNDHDYTSIGKVLLNSGAMRKDEISMQTLKKWLIDHPQQAVDVMHKNQRFIYFKLSESSVNESGPRGSLNVPLTPMRSIAIDPQQITPGSPIWLDTTLPSEDPPEGFQKLVFAQDTGAAIKGRIRADVFFGQGERAEFLAGNMNQSGKMYLLSPK